jgi:hypothetical protein
MKTVWKSFLRDECRSREVTEEERTALSHYHHLQRHFPAMEVFRMPSSSSSSPSSSSSSSLELPSRYYLTQFTSSLPCSSTTREWTALQHDREGKEPDRPCSVFTKVVHLLHPVDYLRHAPPVPSHPLLPSSSPSLWNKTVTKLHHRHNQAYVDAVANFILSRYREQGLLPHLVLYYGTYTGLSQSYRYCLTGEYESYRRYRWFWEGMKTHQSRLTLVHRHEEDVPKEEKAYQEWRKEMVECPIEDDLYSEGGSSSSRSSSRSSSLTEEVDAEELTPLSDIDPDFLLPEPLYEIDTIEETSPLSNSKESEESEEKLEKEQESEESEEEELEEQESEKSEEEEAEWMEETEIFLEIPHFPVLMILQEKQEGSMDQLLEEEALDGYPCGSPEWEKRWVAWLFQVVATLTFLQEALSFTHNDLHTNNILWRATDKPYLYYRLKGKKGVWRVPTYGKIFSLIDFGRSIFRVGKHQWISDDHWPNEDAAGQYNFGPFYDKKQPKVDPNPSFDLCRLAVSLLSGLYPVSPPPLKKGKHVGTLSEEGSWKVYETCSPLYNLLWRWTVDDAGRTVYENRHGEERYDGFDLYIHIAHHVHGAVPKEQLHQGVFQAFLWKQPVPLGESIYGLDA